MQTDREIRLGNVYNDEKYTGGNFGGHVWDSNALAPTMKTGASASQQCVVDVKLVDASMMGVEGTPRVYEDVAPTLQARDYKEPRMICEIKDLTGRENETCLSRAEQSRAEQSRAEQSRAEQSRAEQSSLVLVRQATSKGLIECEVGGIADLNYPTSQTRRGRVIDQGKVSPTLTTTAVPNVIEPWVWEIDGVRYWIRIRKLTPRECWRLMDFTDEDFEKAEKVNSNTQLYKQAGNSICKNVLCEVFRGLMG